MTAELSWLVTAPRSGRAIVIAPGEESGVDDAVTRLDTMRGPAPAWSRTIERTGYWWYAVCIAVAVAVVVSGLALAWRAARPATPDGQDAAQHGDVVVGRLSSAIRQAIRPGIFL
ncbi:hypothetical protein [Prauserella cavernicola]|uniref:Uncharacterized protein n=1 Tax=Prauserella cavernicola TaxID=2800127 RepID=A0A934V593_9PSEU|nr:hypothetical protein [Prauserella cavernicola]MBK1789221.1 hypothetical protein [Prauserella cavernicola]